MNQSTLQEEFERAAHAAGGSVDLRLTLAGRPICVRFAGNAAAEALSPAFAHLRATDGPAPALTLHVWDSATAEVERPAFMPPGKPEVEAGPPGAGASYYHEGEGFRALRQPAHDAVSVLGTQSERAWFWTADVTRLPYWEYTAPFRHLLSWWLDAQGLLQVHGGAVGAAAGGLLLVGAGGSGKSTTALASLLDPRLRYAGDDYVAVGSEPPTVHSLYCSGKVHRGDVDRLPHLAGALADQGRPDEKGVVYVEPTFPGRSIASFPLCAIVLPRVTDRRAARARPVTEAAALSALAPSTIFQLHPPARDALVYMAQLVRRTPTFVLELGADVETIPAELVRLLDELAGR